MGRTRRKQLAIGLLAALGLILGRLFYLAREEAGLLRRLELASRRQWAEARAREREPTEVLVLREAVEEGEVLGPEAVQTLTLPRSLAPWYPHAELQELHPQSREEVVGRVALTDLVAGEPLRRERLARPDELRAVSYRITPGLRAVTVPIDVENSVGGFIRQGDWVDVLASFPLPGGARISKAILQRVRLLIVDRTYLGDGEGEIPADQAHARVGMVTFEVTPSQAEKLVLASFHLPLSLVLRNPENREVEETGPFAHDGTLFPHEPAASPAIREVERILGQRRDRRTLG